MRTKTVQLSAPVTVGGKEISEVTVHATTVGEEEDALQMAVSLKRQLNLITVDLALFSRMCRIPYDLMRTLPSGDYVAIKNAYNEIMGAAPAEDPTQTDGTQESS